MCCTVLLFTRERSRQSVRTQVSVSGHGFEWQKVNIKESLGDAQLRLVFTSDEVGIGVGVVIRSVERMI